MKVFDDLESRGLVKQVTQREKVRELLDGKEPTTFYIGFDPTAESLHVGHLLQLVTAKRLADAGHRPVMLIGGATALIGDPTGKTEMRKMLDHSNIRVNGAAIQSQIWKIMGREVQTINNLLWFEGASFLHVVRDIGRHFSVNTMLRAECFKSRMEHGLSFLEFNYMIMQASDFNWLNKSQGCRLQIGGDDQWSNILAGIDLVHKIDGQEVFGLTLPLLTNSDGTKMGKTERGAVWLDPEKTSPFEFFQFWRNIPDDKVRECLLLFTWMTPDGLVPITKDNINILKKTLAFEVTKLVHGEDAAQEAVKQAEALFESQDLSKLDSSPIREGTNILDLLVVWGIAKSKTFGRQLIDGKGITINDEVLTDPTTVLTSDKFGKSIVVRKGKKQFHLFHFIEATHE